MAHILAADDEPTILEPLEMNLSLAGHTCALAADAREVLLLLSAKRFDIALPDTMLPGRDAQSAFAKNSVALNKSPSASMRSTPP